MLEERTDLRVAGNPVLLHMWCLSQPLTLIMSSLRQHGLGSAHEAGEGIAALVWSSSLSFSLLCCSEVWRLQETMGEILGFFWLQA